MKRTADIQDSILVLRRQQGDGDAFAVFVGRWQERLWRHAARLTGDEDAASDVVQDSWQAVVKGMHRLRDADTFPAWVFRIVTNKARDWVRSQQRRRKLHERVKTEAPPANSRTPSSDARTDLLRAALDQLSVEQRALITLYYEEGFTTYEIAGILGIAQGTVKSRCITCVSAYSG